MKSSKINRDINKIIKEIENKSTEEKLEIIEKILYLIKKEKKIHEITELKGLGKEIWERINTEKYLKKLRKEWDSGTV